MDFPFLLEEFHIVIVSEFFKSRRKGSNLRHPVYQTGTLPQSLIAASAVWPSRFLQQFDSASTTLADCGSHLSYAGNGLIVDYLYVQFKSFRKDERIFASRMHNAIRARQSLPLKHKHPSWFYAGIGFVKYQLLKAAIPTAKDVNYFLGRGQIIGSG